MNLDGITLYLGVTLSTFNLKISDGYGGTWTRELDRANRLARPPKGYIVEAILPPEARQTVLITVDDEGYSHYVAKVSSDWPLFCKIHDYVTV
jgi:hypothetical protein